jgi:hypothetical protein
MSNAPGIEQEGDPQDNFVEARDPAELIMCFILAAAYLGLAKFCWNGLLAAKNWKLLVNVEGFFVIIAVVSILLGLRPYMTPSSLQLSVKGFKYRGPHWPQRKTINWDQVKQVYLSQELIVVLFQPNPNSKQVWPMWIWSLYLAERDKIGRAILKYCPITPVIMTSPITVSSIVVIIVFLTFTVWLFYMFVSP